MIARIKQKSGLTIIEIIISLAILLFGSVAIIMLFTTATRTHKKGSDMFNTQLMLNYIIQEAQEQIDTGSPRDVVDKVNQNFSGSYKYDIKYKLVDQRAYLYEVNIKIKWAESGAVELDNYKIFLYRKR